MKNQKQILENRKALLERQKEEIKRELRHLNLIKLDARELGSADDFYRGLCKETFELNCQILALTKQIRSIDAELAVA